MDGLVFDIKSKDLERRSVINMTFSGVNNDVKIIADKLLSEKINFFKGKNKRKWFSNINSFEIITYKGLYKGIDLKIYSTEEGNIEYDWIIAPKSKVMDT